MHQSIGVARYAETLPVHHECDRVTALRRAAANRKSKPVEAWGDGGALGGVCVGDDREAVPADHGLRAVVDAQELPGQPTGQRKRCSRKQGRIAYEPQSRHQTFNWQWDMLTDAISPHRFVGKADTMRYENGEPHERILRQRA